MELLLLGLLRAAAILADVSGLGALPGEENCLAAFSTSLFQCSVDENLIPEI